MVAFEGLQFVVPFHDVFLSVIVDKLGETESFKHLGALLWVALGLVKGDDAPGCEVRTPEQIGRFLLGNHVGWRRGGCGLDA